jgi:hypothetical protein
VRLDDTTTADKICSGEMKILKGALSHSHVHHLGM